MRVRELPFDLILDEVTSGRADAGLVIHEGQLTYGDSGLHKALDLGAWWQEETGLPLPLGVNAARRDLGDRLGDVSAVLGEAIRSGSSTAARRSPMPRASAAESTVRRPTASSRCTSTSSRSTTATLGRRAVEELLRRSGTGVVAEFVG